MLFVKEYFNCIESVKDQEIEVTKILVEYAKEILLVHECDRVINIYRNSFNDVANSASLKDLTSNFAFIALGGADSNGRCDSNKIAFSKLYDSIYKAYDIFEAKNKFCEELRSFKGQTKDEVIDLIDAEYADILSGYLNEGLVAVAE